MYLKLKQFVLKSENWHWWLALLLTSAFLLIASLRPGGYFWTIDEGGKYTYMLSTLQSENPTAPILYPFRQFDPQAQFPPFFFRIQRGAQFYTWWQPGFALLTIPFYLIFGSAGIYILPAVSGGVTAGLAGAVTAKIDRKFRWLPSLVTLIVGLATPVAFYSQMFWEHTLATALLMASLFLIFLSDETQAMKHVLLAGFLGAASVYFRSEIALIVIGFGLALFFRNRRRAFGYGTGLIVGMAMVMLISYQLNQTLLNPNLGAIFLSSPLGELKMGNFLSSFLFNAPHMYALPLTKSQLFWGMLFTIAAVFLALKRKSRWISALCILGVALIAAQVLFSTAGYRAVHGFLTIAPQVLFASWYFFRRDVYQNSSLPYLVLGGMLIFMAGFVYKSWTAAGGLQWGPRYLLSFYPLLVICGVIALAHEVGNPANNKFFQFLIVGSYVLATGIGFGFSIRGIASAHTLEQYAQQTEMYMPTYSDLPALVTCDINALIPSLYWKQPVFSILRSDMDQWSTNARLVGFDAFYRLSFDLCFLNNIDEIAKYRLENPSGIQAERCSVSLYLAGDNYCQLLSILEKEQ